MKTYNFSKKSLSAMIRMVLQDTLQTIATIDYDALGNNEDKIVAEIEAAMEKQVQHVIDLVDEMDANIAAGPQAVINHLKQTLKDKGYDLNELDKEFEQLTGLKAPKSDDKSEGAE